MEQLFGGSAAVVGDLYVGITHDGELVKRLINQWHSMRTAPAGWRVAFVLTDGITVYGVSTFGHPVARRENQQTTLEHTRMALSPDAPRNSATFFMARSRKWIRENMPEIGRLISYVPSDKYTGVTYRGDNWPIVYADQCTTSRWTNRPKRRDVQNAQRTKFERVP